MWLVRRSDWDELELDDAQGELMMVHPGWTNDRESLGLSIRETGWYFTSGEAFRAAENAELKWGWIGVTEDRTVVICDSSGIVNTTGDEVSEVLQVTLARITTDA